MAICSALPMQAWGGTRNGHPARRTFPPLHLQGRGTARSAVEGILCRRTPLHHPSGGPPPPENRGRKMSTLPADTRRFRAEREAEWRRLEDIVATAERRSVKSLS